MTDSLTDDKNLTLTKDTDKYIISQKWPKQLSYMFLLVGILCFMPSVLLLFLGNVFPENIFLQPWMVYFSTSLILLLFIYVAAGYILNTTLITISKKSICVTTFPLKFLKKDHKYIIQNMAGMYVDRKVKKQIVGNTKSATYDLIILNKDKSKTILVGGLTKRNEAELIETSIADFFGMKEDLL